MTLDDDWQAFAAVRARNDERSKRGAVRYQCVLVFSCFVRQHHQVQVNADEHVSMATTERGACSMLTEYELAARYFTGVPICGVLCQGEICRVNDGVVKLVKSLHEDDICGNTSIFLLLTWLDR